MAEDAEFQRRRYLKLVAEAGERYEQCVHERYKAHTEVIRERQAEHDATVAAGQIDYFFQDSMKLYDELLHEALQEELQALIATIEAARQRFGITLRNPLNAEH